MRSIIIAAFLMVPLLAGQAQNLIDLPSAHVCNPLEFYIDNRVGYHQPYSTSKHTNRYQSVEITTGLKLLTNFEISAKVLKRQGKLGFKDGKSWYGHVDVKMAIPFQQFMENPFSQTRWPLIAVGIKYLSNDKYLKSYSNHSKTLSNDVTYNSAYWIFGQSWNPGRHCELAFNMGSGNHWFSDSNLDSFLFNFKGWFAGGYLSFYKVKLVGEIGARSVNAGMEIPIQLGFADFIITGNLYRLQVLDKALKDELAWIGFEHERFKFDGGIKIHFYF